MLENKQEKLYYGPDKTNKIQNFLNKIMLGKLLIDEPIKRETTNNRMTAFRNDKNKIIGEMMNKTSLSALEINRKILVDLFDFYRRIVEE